MTGKKIIIVDILRILQKYTDSNNTMTQQQIADKLREEYDLDVDRGAIKRSLTELIEAGYDIQFQEIKRNYKNKRTGEMEEGVIYTNIYYDHDFSESELRLLIDGLLFSRSVPYAQRKKLIDKLGKLATVNFNTRMNHVQCLSSESPQNPELFHTIDVLDEAITCNKQVEITYNQYGADMKLHPKLTEDGKGIKRQLLNPYQMVASEGRYYLICNNDHHESVGTYRIDRMTDIALQETTAKPKSLVKGLENGLNIENYIYQNVDMFASETCDVEFETGSDMVGVVIDFFGKNVHFQQIDRDDMVKCKITASKKSIKRWGFMFSNQVRILSPQSLVDEIRDEIKKAIVNYDVCDP